MVLGAINGNFSTLAIDTGSTTMIAHLDMLSREKR